MIQFENINKSFGKIKVLNNISANFEQGQSIAILGPNGSGKTTLIKTLLGMVVPDNGEIYFDGKSIKNAFEYRNKLGYMPQIGHYPPNLKISQLIDMMVDIRNSEQNIFELDEELIELFKLKEIENKPLGTLSGGTTQKVSAALAFLFNPKVLILDEPTAGLDPLSSEILKEKIFKEKQKGKLILITSHIMSDLDELASHIMYLQDGKLQFFKELETLKLEVGEERLNKIIAILIEQKINEKTLSVKCGN
jgi:Cu-processing system ATP-binding protein